MVNDLIQRDLKHIWHPCSQMKDFETVPPFIVKEAKGSYLYTDKGPLIDANSSWWCKSLGHNHPDIMAAIQKQLSSFEHVIGANTTHAAVVELAEELTEICQLQHAFFASDGSCAVEIAMKLAIHARQITDEPHKNKFIALKNAYHGETLGTLAVSDLGIYKAPYQSFGPDCYFIENIPYVESRNDPLWANAEGWWNQTEKALNPIVDEVCALIVEPIIQGAGGMKIYSADFLRRLGRWAKSKGIYIIADEIMTGFGRTGKWLASEHSQLNPDIVCLSKGLTSGTMPFSCAMISHPVFDLFYDDYDKGKSFLHSHTYSGHALGACAALATIRVMKNAKILEQVQQLEGWMHHYFHQIADQCGQLSNIRHLGGVIAADLSAESTTRAGYQIYINALESGAYLRPLGNTLYWMPPLNTDEITISKLAQITLNSINKAYSK